MWCLIAILDEYKIVFGPFPSKEIAEQQKGMIRYFQTVEVVEFRTPDQIGGG